MNNRLTTSDLINALAESTGKSNKVCEAFLKEFITTISEGIQNDRLVKIKGLGTFKIIEVEKRESVDVNTGERFIIPAHFKYTFSADKKLKDLVNKPFESFETTELNEDAVAFSDSETASENEPDNENKVVEAAEAAEADETVQEPLPPAEKKIDEPSAEGKKEENPPAIAEKKTDKPVAKIPVKPFPVQPLKEYRDTQSEKSKAGVYSVLLFLLIIISGAFFYFTRNIEQAKLNNNSNYQELATENKQKAIQSETAVHSNLDEISGDSDETPGNLDKATSDDSDKAVIEKKQESISLSPAEGENLDKATSDDSDKVVIEKKQESISLSPAEGEKELVTETIRSGIRLTLIAQKHFGHKAFWVYIYEHNKSIIKNPNDIPIGTVLVIPDASLYGINPNDPASVDKAKKIQETLSEQFN